MRKLIADKVLSVDNLNVNLENHQIIENINFELNREDSLALIGPNGSGKTVLLKALLGLIPYEGNIIWSKKSRIGYVPQKINADRHLPLTLFNLLTAKAHLLKTNVKEIDKLVATVNIDPSYLHLPVGHLSGGQFQKGLIAFALLGHPNVLLFDEPTASLDQSSEEHIYELLNRLQNLYRLTIVIVSHDLSLVYRYATKVLCVNKTQQCFGLPQKVLTHKVLTGIYGPSHKYYSHYHHKKDES